MINVNSKEIRRIKINNKNINAIVLNKGTQSKGVWARSLNKSITPATGTSLSVRRSSSPYRHASIGNINYMTDDFYWGDVLGLTCNVNEGYTFVKFVIDGEDVTDNPTTMTCSKDITSISTVANKNAEEWHLMFTGTKDSTHNTSTSAKTYSMTFSGLRANKPTRVTGSLMRETDVTVSTFQNWELPYETTYSGKTQSIKTVTSSNTLKVTLQKPTGFLATAPFFRITKIEQYY